MADVVGAGRRGLGVSTDVADRSAVESAADRVEAELGPILLWVNNAMIGVFGEFMSMEPADFDRAVAVNFGGVVNGTRAALSRMEPRGKGGVIQIGSALAHRGIPLQAAYCSAKRAITGFTESLTTELLHNGSKLTLSQVDMPAINTLQFEWVKSQLPHHPMPVPPIYQPELCAEVVADVAQKPRRRTWVGAPTVMTVLGNRFASRVVDWQLARSGYDSQQAPELKKAMMGPNLYAPVAGDHGAHGSFDDQAKSSSLQIWGIRHRAVANALGYGALAAGFAAGVTALRFRRR